MIPSVDIKELNIQVEKICNSKEFSKSETHSKLLQYIVSKSVKGESIKEISIALEIFNEDASYNPGADSRVRSTVHYLRRKLDSYYQNEGKYDTVRIEIPKGHYTAKIEALASSKKDQPKNHKIFLIFSVLLSFLFLALWVSQLLQNNDTCINKKNVFWGDFFKNNSKTSFIPGDHYFYIENKDSGGVKIIRDIAINSNEDMDQFLSKSENKNNNISKTSHTYLTKRIPWSMYYILPDLTKNDNLVEMKLSSEIQPDDLNSGNIIYTGAFRSLGLLNQSIQKLPIKYDNINGTLSIIKTDNETPLDLFADECHAFQQKMKDVKDYAVIAKLKNNGHTQVFVLSTHDVGVISTVRYFTEHESLSEFLKRYNITKDSPYFCAVFEVNGIERTDFDVNLVYFQKID